MGRATSVVAMLVCGLGFFGLQMVSDAAEIVAEHPADLRRGVFFEIARNKNRNRVYYRVKGPECELKAENVEVFWHMLELGDDVTEPLRFWEKPAYGFSAKNTPNGVQVTLNALPDKSILLRAAADGACDVVGHGMVAGQDAVVRSVYVYAEERSLGPPKVLWLNLYGTAVSGSSEDEEIIEKIVP